MTHHKGKRIFISGIPTSGKSYLAKQLADKVGGVAVLFDNFRENLAQNDKYKKWTNFYLDVDEKEYLTKTTPEKQWENLVAQSEGLWPAFLQEIEKYKDEVKPVIFECVNILPHIAKKHLDFPGIVLIGKSYEEILERNIKSPRWGNTRELQELEAKAFFKIERPHYKAEAEKYGYFIFESADEAFSYTFNLLCSEVNETLMTQKDVIELYKELDNVGIKIWIDGGFCVDALLDKQLRPHKDIDIAVQWKDVQKLREILTARGYKQVKEDSQWNFVLRDDNAHEIDVHAFIYDDKGNIVEGIMYPSESLTGTGVIEDQSVRCISPKYMVEFLAPWISKWPDKYLPAISEICEQYKIELPKEYKEYLKLL